MRWLCQMSLAVLLAVGFGASALHAASTDNETRLREALRSALTQLRAAEDERAVLQAKQASSAKETESLRAQVAALTKELDDSVKKTEFERAVNEFNMKLSMQNETIAQLSETLDKWKVAYNEAVTVARAKEAQRAQLAVELGGMQKQYAVCRDANGELYKIGSEILDRYAGVGVSDAFTTREPFVGFKRVELQNLVQDYQDQLLDRKIAP